MASQAISFTDPNPALCNPWMDSGLDSPLGPYPLKIKDDEVTKADLRMFLPISKHEIFYGKWLRDSGKYFIRCALEALGTPSQRCNFKWIKSGTPFLLKIELFARSLFKILNAPEKINRFYIRPELFVRALFKISNAPGEINLKPDLFANMIAFLEERVNKLEAKQESSKVARGLSKAASALNLSFLRKKAYHWERYAGEENKSIPIADQIKRLRAATLTFHACYCTDHKDVYMKDSVRLVEAVVHLREAQSEQDRLDQARLTQAKLTQAIHETKSHETKSENASLQKAFDLEPALKEMSLEQRKELAKAPIHSAALKILEFIRSDTRPIAQEQTDYLRDRTIQAHRRYRDSRYVEDFFKLEPLKIGEANILKYAYHRTGLLIDPISDYTWQGVEYSSNQRSDMYYRYETAQKLIQEENYVFRAEGSAPTHIEGATAPSKEEAYEGSSTGSGSLPPSPPSHTGYGMGAGIGAGAVDSVPPPEVPSQHPGSRTPFPTAPFPEPTAPIEEIDIFDKGEIQQETEPAKVLVNGKWIEV